MFIIGAKLNAGIPGMGERIAARDANAIVAEAEAQLAYGAGAIDINCGNRHDTEQEDMIWLADVLSARVKAPLCVDTPDAAIQAAVLPHCTYGRPFINSTTLEKERMSKMLPLAKQYKARVIVLLHDETGIPKTAAQRVALLPKVAAMLAEYGLSADDLYLDPLLPPLSVREDGVSIFLDAVRQIKAQRPEYHIICGGDNVCHGLPEPELLTVNLMAACAGAGQDSSLMILSPRMRAYLTALNTLMGEDEYCMNYIEAFREGALHYEIEQQLR